MNKKMKKTLISTLSVAFLSVSAMTAVSAHDGKDISKLPQTSAESVSIIHDQMSEQKVYFRSITGIVQEINPYGQDETMQIVTLETSDGLIYRVVITDQTYLIDEITVGAELIAFYDATKPVIMIYPPQFHAEVIASTEDGRTVKADRFDQRLTSADGTLTLNVSDETEIIREDGSEYTGELSDRNLAVIYYTSTRSIPAQTTPETIVVLDEQNAALEEQEKPADDTIKGRVVLDDKKDHDTDADEQIAASYGKIQGEITEIFEQKAEQPFQRIAIETHDEQTIHINISDETYLDQTLELGDEITVFYDQHAPMLMIYPPQYDAEAVVNMSDSLTSVMLDVFDENLLSSDGSLKLQISESTEIVTQDGNVFEGEIANQKLLVEYEFVALSYPAKTTPKRIVVFADEEVSQDSEDSEVVQVIKGYIRN